MHAIKGGIAWKKSFFFLQKTPIFFTRSQRKLKINM